MAFNVNNPVGSGTPAEMLVLIEAAIVTVATMGQNYMIGGRTFTRADLGELRQIRRDLKLEIASTSASAGSRDNFAVRRRAL